MEPVGLTLTVISLPAALTMTFKSLRKTVKSIKYAKRELQDLDEEINLFADIYDTFLDACDEASLDIEGASRIKRHLRSWTEKVKEGFRNLLHRVQAVGRDPRYEHSTIEVITAHYRWIMSKSTLRYLRACLNVARQSMVAFTNIRVLGKLNEELAFLQSALTSTAERQSIELRHGVGLEERIQVVQMKTHNRRTQRHKIDRRLDEVINQVRAYEEKNIDHDLVPQEKPLLQFRRSVDRFVDQIVSQEKSDRKARRMQDSSSVLTSESSATTPTQSTQSSYDPRQAPESPPTSPEPSIARGPTVEIQPEENKPSPTIPVLCSLRKFQPLRLTPIKHKQVPPSGPPTDTRLSHLSDPDVPPADEVRWIMHVDPKILGEDKDDPEDGISEEEIPTEKQATGSKPSIWKAASGQQGDMPKSLRIHRQRSRSPQDFW